MRQEQMREGRKGKTPKEETACESNLGHTVKNGMTVIRVSDGALLVAASDNERIEERIFYCRRLSGNLRRRFLCRRFYLAGNLL